MVNYYGKFIPNLFIIASQERSIPRPYTNIEAKSENSCKGWTPLMSYPWWKNQLHCAWEWLLYQREMELYESVWILDYLIKVCAEKSTLYQK